MSTQRPTDRVAVYLTPDERRRLKIYAAEHGTTMNDLLRIHVLGLLGDQPQRIPANSADRT